MLINKILIRMIKNINGIVHQVKSAGGTLGPRKFFNLLNLLTPLVLPLVLSPPRRFPIKTIRNFIRELERKTPCQSSSPSHAEVRKEQTRITPWTACVSLCVYVCVCVFVCVAREGRTAALEGRTALLRAQHN